LIVRRCALAWALKQVHELKQFFFEKKNQETSARLSRSSPRQPRKSFCFFLQKEALPS